MTGQRTPTTMGSSEAERPPLGSGSGTPRWSAWRGKLTTPHLHHVPRWITWFAVCVAFGFLGWLIYLSTGITSIVTTHHYDIAWLGFDAFELSMVAAVAVAAWKHHRSTTIFTGICAVMFAVDGWFDVWTSPRGGVLGAALLAICLEIPLVAIFTVATIHGERAKTKARVAAEARPGRTRCARETRTSAVSLRRGTTVQSRGPQRHPDRSSRSARPAGLLARAAAPR